MQDFHAMGRENTLEWLETSRKIPVDLAAANGVIETPSGLGFQYIRNDALQYVKLRISGENGDKSFRRDRKGVETCLWGFDTLSDTSQDGTIVIVEGEIDRLSVLASGIGPCVSVPDGAQLAEEGKGAIIPEEDKPFSWLWNGDKLIDGIGRAKRVILAVDGDEKGKVLRNELAVRIGRNKCFFVRWPDYCKDANDVLVRYGEDRLRKLLDDADPIIPLTLSVPSAFAGMPKPISHTVGIPEFDKMFKFSPPSLCAVTGPPNSGKSQVALFISMMMAKNLGVRTAYLQFEDHPAKLVDDVHAFWGSHGACADESETWADEYFRFIAPEQFDRDVAFTTEWLTKTIEQAALRESCKHVVLDPWNEIEHAYDGRQKSIAQYLNDALREMKHLARRLDIMLTIVAHPDKASGRVKSIEDWDLYALDGGAAWNNKADQGLVVLINDDNPSERFFKTCKSRDFRRWGSRGHICMQFDPKSRSYKCVKI